MCMGVHVFEDANTNCKTLSPDVCRLLLAPQAFTDFCTVVFNVFPMFDTYCV